MSNRKQKVATELPIDPDTGSVDTARLAAEREQELREPPGHRVGYNPNRSAPRPAGEMSYKAVLVRGVSFRITYAGGALVFEKDVPTPITAHEFERLVGVCDPVDFSDGERRVRRRLRKFRFTDMNDESVPLDEIEDEYLDASAA